MSVRINKAKNFKGKAYVAADELDSLVKSIAFAPTDAITAKNTAGSWKLNFTTADGGVAATSAVDLTSIKDYIDNKSITVTAGNGVSIDSTNALSPTITADIDSSTIVFVGDTDGAKKLATNLSIKKLDTTTSGFAASYALFAGTTQLGTTDNVINIVKDQFLKSGTLVYGVDAGTEPTGKTEGNDQDEWTSKGTGHTYPWIKLVMYTNNNGSSNDDTLLTTIYIPVNDLLKDKTAGNYIDSTALTSNVIKVNVGDGIDSTETGSIVVKKDSASEQVYANGAAVDVFSISANGLKIANIQSAINDAVKNEHEKASAAIENLESDVLVFASATSGAVDTLNTRIANVAGYAATAISNASDNLSAQITGVATNAQTAVQKVGSAVDALDTSVSAAIDNVNTNVEAAIDSAIGNVDAAITATVSTVNTNVGNAVTSVNTMVSGSIDSVNSSVSGAVASVNTMVSGSIDSVNSSVGALKNTVSASISAVNSSVAEFKDTVSATFETVSAATEGIVADAVAAIDTKLTNAIKIVESTVTIADNDYSTGSGVITKTVEAKYILAVYGKSSVEIYPEIERGTTATNGVYTFTLTADYGASPAANDKDEAWNVICVNPLPDTGSYDNFATNGYSNTVAYTNGTNSVAYTNAAKAADATYTNAAKANDASYSTAAATATTAVDAADVVYTKGTTVSATTVADGTPGEASIAVASGTSADAPATNGIAVEKAAPDYAGYNA